MFTFARALPSRRRDDYGEPILLSQEEVAHRLAISRTTLWRLVKAGDLEAIHIGSRALIVKKSLDEFLASKRTTRNTN